MANHKKLLPHLKASLENIIESAHEMNNHFIVGPSHTKLITPSDIDKFRGLRDEIIDELGQLDDNLSKADTRGLEDQSTE